MPTPKTVKRILSFTAVGLVLLLAIVVALLQARPPALLRVAANYSTKIVCSNVFLAARDPEEVLRDDVQSNGNPVLRLMRASVDRDRRLVRAGVLGVFGDGLAVARPGEGCGVLADGKLAPSTVSAPGPATAALPAATGAPQATTGALRGTTGALRGTTGALRVTTAGAPWPEGNTVAAAEPRLAAIVGDPRLAGPGIRALVVVHAGRVVAERYAPGFTADTPLLGWSMTKSVMAGLIGMLIKDGRLALDGSAGWPAVPGDGRAQIKIADLLAMSSGLHFDEGYAAVSDVTRMLYLEPDMAAFARAQPLDHPVGTVWSYSSGTALILSRLFQDAAGMPGPVFVRTRLFEPLGMRTAIMETDERGTLVGSSYMYASARDWARYGLFLLNEGIWQGQPLLPASYVAMMRTPVAASGGQYGHGQVWLWGSDADPAAPGVNPDRAFDIPSDTFWMEGHDGQSIAIIPSRELVVVRMGLTPHDTGYRPQPLVQAILRALG